MKDVLMLRFQTATKFQRKSVTQLVTNQEGGMAAAIVPVLMDQAMSNHGSYGNLYFQRNCNYDKTIFIFHIGKKTVTSYC